MSRCSSLNHLKAYASAALSLWSLAAGGIAHAQTAVAFSDLDWTVDRGNRDFNGTGTIRNGTPARLGANNIYATGNNPGAAVRRWTFPFTRDLYGFGNSTAVPVYSVIDNPNTADPLTPDGTGQSRYLPYAPLTNGSPETGPGYTAANATAGELPGFAGLPKPRSVFTNGTARSWILPPIAYRAGGYSRESDPSQTYNFDYNYVLAKHDDFPVVTGTDQPAIPLNSEQAEAFPEVSANIYRAVHQRLIASTATEPYAQWSSGQLQTGRYSVELYSPGNGTDLRSGLTADIRPNTAHVFVRVSWKGTVDGAGNYIFGTGVAGAGGINDPVNSRIYSVNLGQAGWIRLQGSASTSGFPYNGTQADQLVVTQYTITPDDLANDYLKPPVLSADAVRFTALLLPGAAGLGPVGTNGGYVSASGRMLGPAVSSSNITSGVTVANPLFYFAREEYTTDTTLRLSDPTNANSVTIADPVSLAVVPVFYCIDNQNGDAVLSVTPVTLITTKDKVRWRYVGAPFTDAAPGTSNASPVLANVRCRDGQVRSMVYFATTTTDGTLGRVYAFDPVGNRTAGTTSCYWAYPSVRPLIGNEYQAMTGNVNDQAKIPSEFQDPNYTLTGFTRAGYPGFTFGNDTAAAPDGTFYFDGDIARSLANTSLPAVRTDTRLTTARKPDLAGGGTLGGVQASPLIVDDPANPNGTSLLIVPSMNGRVYAFDAGGRGDFGDTAQVTNAPGTTQRLWTWPHLGVDGFRHLSPGTLSTKVNTLTSDADRDAFPSTPSMDTSNNNTTGPVFVGGGSGPLGTGYLYSLNLGRDVYKGIANGAPVFTERRAWQYPSVDAPRSLGAPPSVAAVYNFEGNRATPLIYFTSGGRVYTVNPATLLNTPSGVPAATLQWVYPFTSTIPIQEPGVDATVALDPGFLGNAPLLQQARWSDNSLKYLCTVVTSAGRILTLDPAGNGGQQTTLLASTQSINGSTVRTSPIASLLTGQLDLDTTPNRPALIFGDDNGSILGYATSPDALDPVDPNTGLPFNRILWRYTHPAANSAGAILSNSLIGMGDEVGIYHAYGIGTGAGGRGETTGPNPDPPGIPGRNIQEDDGTVNIDMRSFDIYDEADFNQMMLTATGGRTPGHTVGGGNFGRTANPSPGDFSTGNAVVREWGDGLYVVAWGVYHALPQDASLPLYGTTVPRINVTFRITGPTNANGVALPTSVITAPASYLRPDGQLWPADMALTNGEMDTLKMSGYVDPPGAMARTLIQFTGRADGVYPWVVKVPIVNNGFRIDYNFNPGAAYRISAVATISQNYGVNGSTVGGRSKFDTSAQLFLGQRDYVGKTNDLEQKGLNDTTLGKERSVFIAHPFAVSVRGAANAGESGPNLIGWFPDISTVAGNNQKGEVLSNFNNRSLPIISTTSDATSIGAKALFAPVGMIPDGASKGYTVLGGASGLTNLPGLYIADRSNLARNTGTRVSVRASTIAGQWKGGTSSVMNPLPWEQFPSETETTADYPALAGDAFALSHSGKSLTDSSLDLEAPGGFTTRTRTLIPTQIDLTVKVPKFQPANVNFGRWNDPIRGNYGAGFLGDDGVILGDGTLNNPMFGPLTIATGRPTPIANQLYPSGGYISRVLIRATNAENVTRIVPSLTDIYDLNAATGNKGPAARLFNMGVSVPPTVRMRIAEKTIDLGKLSHSAGYSNLNPMTGLFTSPYAPFDATSGYNPTGATPEVSTYWSNYFRPFTLVSDSNINLSRVRIAKLFGENGSNVNLGSLTNFPGTNTAAALQIGSSNVNNVSSLPIFGLGFAATGVGNIGLVSSFDHRSTNSPNYRETDLWANVRNPFVTSEGISSAGLPTADRAATGELGWGAGRQRQPTVHKPRTGDVSGTIASIPDTPYNASLDLQFPGTGGTGTAFQTELPKLSLAIPLGTPSGDYGAQILAFEDNTPFQWKNWLSLSGNPTAVGADADGILNSHSNDPIKVTDYALEPFTDPGTTLKVTVVESRLTNNSSKGSLAQLDPMQDPTLGLLSAASANLMPTAVTFLGPPNNGSSFNAVSMFWATNRGANNGANVNALTPWNMAYSWLNTSVSELKVRGNAPVQFGDANFVENATSGPQSGHWWSNPVPFSGQDAGNNPLTVADLFPSNTAEAATMGAPYLPGTANFATGKVTSPAATRLEVFGTLYSLEGVLFWQGQIIKTTGLRQTTDSRTFYTKLGVVGGKLTPVGATRSFLNDPALTKQNPKPLYVTLPAANGNPVQTITFLFWQAGNRSKTQLYYNVNPDNNLDPTAWSADTILPTPAALSFLSEPTATVRSVTRSDGSVVNAIDVAYSGQIKNRDNVEILLSRFEIVRQTIGGVTKVTLKPLALPRTIQEPTTAKAGAVGTYIARDAAWVLDNNVANEIIVSIPGTMPYTLRQINAGRGKFDEGTGLVYFNSDLGGQIIVDTRSGSVTFPNVTLPRGVPVYVNYTPQVMRLNASRSESNFDLVAAQYGGFSAREPSLYPKPSGNLVGNNTNPTMIMDRSPNRRNRLYAPAVVFAPNGVPISPLAADANIPSIARRWLLYRKASSGTGSGIYYKTQRVMLQLPTAVRVNYNANGTSFVALSILSPLSGSGYEVDWTRGRVYFDEQMDGVGVKLAYTDSNGGVHDGMVYIPKWGDETNSSTDGGSTEVRMPIDTSVSEGQVSAYKDPFLDKLWVYWASTRNGVSDLYYQTIAPQFYPTAANQR